MGNHKNNGVNFLLSSFETDEGIKRSEQGAPLAIGGMSQSGSYEYIGPDGQVYKIEFIADENGFRPVGDHLPTPPPLPPALQRFEDAKNGKLRNDSGLRKGRQFDLHEDPKLQAEVFQRKNIRFGQPGLVKKGAHIRFGELKA